MILKKFFFFLKGIIKTIFRFIFWIFKKKIFIGILAGIVLTVLFNVGIKYSSSDKFCESCHVHPHSTLSWKKSGHFDNKSGVTVHCIECHLPPSGNYKYYTEKARLGAQDAYGKLFKDISKINWDEKSTLNHAGSYTYDESCIHCHENLFPIGLSKKGEDAHLYYTRKTDEILCINCHLYTGHYSENARQEFDFGQKPTEAKIIYKKPATVTEFENYTEYIPNSSVKFDMIAIPGGTFTMGSPDKEPLRNYDEGPQIRVDISPFWMGKVEVTWDEFEAFYAQTHVEGRTDTQIQLVSTDSDVDAVTGPTPPYGNPGQGFGKGDRPAITMTHYTAEFYCQWLSDVTGKKYRLPTEAEWEYACRAGTEGAYFFDGNPKKFTRHSFWNRMFGPDTATINSYIIYKENSMAKTQPFSSTKPNPFGLYNMLGNVKEFCRDWYAPNIYMTYHNQGSIKDPAGPESGKEHVIRGGSFNSDAAYVRSAARDYTQYNKWMRTDPQMPKSLWWYSDVVDVGFRVVCEYDGEE
ncbi:SUMF1/EgtB/PvdO family nonheme iron enzyme [candidate division KSB1 bacterium]|nr:SUMF1/EgtB/PvdO family nonheme iron enzyme [candidate division KSB1 bacterium]